MIRPLLGAFALATLALAAPASGHDEDPLGALGPFDDGKCGGRRDVADAGPLEVKAYQGDCAGASLGQNATPCTQAVYGVEVAHSVGVGGNHGCEAAAYVVAA